MQISTAIKMYPFLCTFWSFLVSDYQKQASYLMETEPPAQCYGKNIPGNSWNTFEFTLKLIILSLYFNVKGSQLLKNKPYPHISSVSKYSIKFKSLCCKSTPKLICILICWQKKLKFPWNMTYSFSANIPTKNLLSRSAQMEMYINSRAFVNRRIRRKHSA